MKWFSVICVMCLVLPIWSANILVLEGVPSPSHHIFITTLSQALAARGHNITSISADLDPYKTPNVTHLYLDKFKEYMEGEKIQEIDMVKYGRMNPWLMMLFMPFYMVDYLDDLSESLGYKKLLEYPDDFKFDMVLYDFLFGPSLLPFVHKFKNPPLVGLTAFYSTSYTAPFIGSVFHPSFVPYGFIDTFTVSSFWSRLNNYLIYFADYVIREKIVTRIHQRHMARNFPGLPSLDELQRQMKLVIMNRDPTTDYIEPTLPNVIAAGGMQIQALKELPQDLAAVMEKTEKGVVLFSLGSNMRSDALGEERLTQIIKAIREFPDYTFIWKFESTFTLDVPKNLIILKWVPQNEILAHPNTKLFITHCGLLSTQEAAWHGVPIVGLPVFADQFLNIQKSVEIGVALTVDLANINAEALQDSIHQVLQNSSFYEKARIRSRLFRDQSETPLERAIWWCEYILRNPDVSFLRSGSLDLNILQRHSIDVIAFLTIVTLSLIIFFTYIIWKIIRASTAKGKYNKKKNE
ncbi:hypothetical protein DMENIID0001_036040 [Sergentomyia squamirostris]